MTDCSDIGAGGGRLTLMYQSGTLVLCGANANGHYWKQFIEGEFKRRRLVALSASAGYELWSRDANYRHRPIVVGRRIIAEPWSYDLFTGEQETRLHPLTGKQVPWSTPSASTWLRTFLVTPQTRFATCRSRENVC